MRAYDPNAGSPVPERAEAWHTRVMSRALPLAILAAFFSFTACPPDAPGDDGGDPPVDVILGGVVLEQDRAPFWQASASFAEPVANGCEAEEIGGGCTLLTCQPGEGGVAPEPAQIGHLDAGAVTVESEARTATLVRDADGLYAAQRVDGEEFFENGGELFATATGGADVEGFTLTLRGPTPLQIVTPPLASVTVRVTEPLDTEWTGASQGELSFTLSDNVGALRATCTAPSAAGAFAIPAEIIGRFPLGEGTLSIIGRVAVTADLANARHVTFTAQTPATSATGTNANYFVTFAAP